jgi:hypothetical protein
MEKIKIACIKIEKCICIAASTIMIPTLRRGGACLQNGLCYEKKVAESLSTLVYEGHSLQLRATTAGATSESDIRFTLQAIEYGIEVKDKKAFEGGQKRMIPGDTGLFIPEDCLHKECLSTYIPFQGRIPSFLKGDKRPEQWLAEKHLFADEYISVDSKKVAEYYRRKGESYIQVEGKGLYHLGQDVLAWGVPEFVCETLLRIRCKCHKSTPMHRSIMTSFIYKKETLKSSPFDLVTKPPLCFTRVVESESPMTSLSCSSHMTKME